MLIYIYQTNTNMPINPKNKKEEARATLLRHLGLPKGTRAMVISYIQDPQIFAFFRDACEAIGIFLITEIDDIVIAGADIWITDSLDLDIPLASLLEKWVVPVLPFDKDIAWIWSEFDPMKSEWNAFMFESKNPFQMFEKLIRALENMRYIGDKRMLLKNIQSTKI